MKILGNFTIDAWIAFGFLAQFLFFFAICSAMDGIGKKEEKRYSDRVLVFEYCRLSNDIDLFNQKS